MEIVELAFEEFGNPEHAPLIILHGFFASSRNWRNIATKLAASYHVFVLDQRNHGASPHHSRMDYAALVADLWHYINSRNFNKVSLLGHSMGGKVAMWFALNYPDSIDKLMIVDIAPVSYQHSFDKIITALQALPLAELSNRKQAEEWLTTAISDQSERQFLLQNLLLTNGIYSWRINLDIFQHNALHITAFPETKHLAPFTGKVLFIAGEQSSFVKPEDLRDLFPGAVFNRIANAGHWLHVQQPADFLSLVLGF